MSSRLTKCRYLMPFALAYLNSDAIGKQPSVNLRRIVVLLPEILRIEIG